MHKNKKQIKEVQSRPTSGPINKSLLKAYKEVINYIDKKGDPEAKKFAKEITRELNMAMQQDIQRREAERKEYQKSGQYHPDDKKYLPKK